jgi:hypothetical protein
MLMQLLLEENEHFKLLEDPQYSKHLLQTLQHHHLNGTSGGVIAFNVSGTFNFNGKTIDGNARISWRL